MTDRARRERRQRQAHRRQVRRRRGVALVSTGALILLLVSLVGYLTPAAATSQPAKSGTEEVAPANTPPPCHKGEVEIEKEVEGETRFECEPKDAESEKEEEATEETAAEAPAPAPEGGDGAEAPPAPQPAPASETTSSAPAAKPAAAGKTATSGSKSVVPGSSIDAPHGHHRGEPSGKSPGGGTSSPTTSEKHRSRHHNAVSHSGGTPAGAEAQLSQPHIWGWSGSWAIPWQIVACESGGDYGALNASSGAGGAYQIIPSTWSAYGGSGEPQSAPPAEQDRIASEIWADSGPSAWVCAQEGNWVGATLSSFSGLGGSLGRLPDPLPPARRLDPRFVALLTRTARASHVDWALLLAIARLNGGRGRFPASAAELRRLAARTSSLGRGPLAKRARLLFAGRRAQRLVALTYYDRAVGLRGLVEGLERIKGGLQKRVLRSRRLEIYAGGREDVAAGRVDVRVLTLLLYLSQRYRSVDVSCLITGHSLLTSAGRPSLHPLGRAVDIAALNGVPILGHQQPGGITERALRLILMLPREMQPSELISLFDLGGPSFALADHADHIHVGF